FLFLNNFYIIGGFSIMWQSIIDGIATVNGFINDLVWGWPAIIMILGTGILLTIRTKAMQLRKLKASMQETIGPVLHDLGKKPGKQKSGVSQFEAFSAAISGTVGTGNIIGVTSAILTGGPGAVFWMWISAFFGMITNYAENVLGLYYRKKEKDGSFSGGSFYYITYGLGWAWLGYIAAAFCIIAAIGMSGVQTNKISGTLTAAFGSDTTAVKLAIGGAVALLTAIIIIGGIKRIGKIASMIVPFMSLLFIILSIFGILMHASQLLIAIELIFSNVFSCQAFVGGLGGYVFAQIIRKGMARGVFSNEAGLGSSVIAHSASETREPVKQGLWGIFEVFFDTFIICTLTALLLLTTFDINTLSAATGDSELAMKAFSDNFGMFGTVCFSVILPLFAFTTILAWAYYGEKGFDFCFRKCSDKTRKIAVLCFKLVYVLLIVASAVIESDLVWDISDTANGLMALPNLVAVIGLSGVVVKITKNYYERRRGFDEEPMLSAYPEQNEEFKQDILAMGEVDEDEVD
ncbi:MAG: amino acid carrier protein, partial [Clostridia bacterium]|nr:amino acid carrier protein [Clostridia bacterium]